MSWSLNKTGRAGSLAVVVTDVFSKTGGCPLGSAEETAKNSLGGVAETLLKSLPPDKVVTIAAQGSAWNNPDGSAQSQSVKFELSTHGDFVE